MIDMRRETLISLRELGKFIKRGESTVRRLANQGARGLSGEIVRLDVIRTPSGMRTTTEAWYRFLAKLNKC